MNRSISVTTLFPRLTSAAADDANAVALARRAAARGLSVRLITVERAEDFVDSDIYLLGGTGREGVASLVDVLSGLNFSARLLEHGTVLAVDAGLDALAASWVDPTGAERAGLGVAPIRVTMARPAMGTVVARPASLPSLPDPPLVIGWEWNAVHTELDASATPLFKLQSGLGNRTADRGEGVVTDDLLGTRLHGPLLALNPELSDLLLARAVGAEADDWAAIEDAPVMGARAERIAEALAGRQRGRSWLPRRRGALQ